MGGRLPKMEGWKMKSIIIKNRILDSEGFNLGFVKNKDRKALDYAFTSGTELFGAKLEDFPIGAKVEIVVVETVRGPFVTSMKLLKKSEKGSQ